METATFSAMSRNTLTVSHSVRPSAQAPWTLSKWRGVVASRKLVNGTPSPLTSLGLVAAQPTTVTISPLLLIGPPRRGPAGPAHSREDLRPGLSLPDRPAQAGDAALSGGVVDAPSRDVDVSSRDVDASASTGAVTSRTVRCSSSTAVVGRTRAASTAAASASRADAATACARRLATDRRTHLAEERQAERDRGPRDGRQQGGASVPVPAGITGEGPSREAGWHWDGRTTMLAAVT